MLLLLTLIYIFHSFQTQAAPLNNLIESVGNTTFPSTSASVCPADQRSIWDILWSCLATIFACSWLSVHPNIPGPNEAWWRVFLRRLELMFWAIVGPELLITFAFRQWLGARRLEELYKEKGWTKTHTYFFQMGGFMLYYGEEAKGVLSPRHFAELLDAKKIAFPTITAEEIEDRSKADGFSKTIALGQTLWFVVQCLARRAEQLDITLVELLTLSLAVLNGFIYFLWWHKPLDVRYSVRVYLLDKPNESCEAADSENFNLSHLVYSILRFDFSSVFSYIPESWPHIWQSLSTLGKVLILIGLSTIMSASLLTLIPIILFLFPVSRWVLIISDDEFNKGDMKVPIFYSFARDGGEKLSLAMLCIMSVTGVVFGGIHCAGWFFIFPSDGEAILWRVCSVAVTGTAFLLPLLCSFFYRSASFKHPIFVAITVTLGFFVYVLSRLLLLVEAFISLRHLTPGMLALVKWTSFIPHI